MRLPVGIDCPCPPVPRIINCYFLLLVMNTKNGNKSRFGLLLGFTKRKNNIISIDDEMEAKVKELLRKPNQFIAFTKYMFVTSAIILTIVAS
jgi:hypothetical protein